MVEKINDEKERIQELVDAVKSSVETTPTVTPSASEVLSATSSLMMKYEATPTSRYKRTLSGDDIKTTPTQEPSNDIQSSIRERDVKIASLEKQLKYLTVR